MAFAGALANPDASRSTRTLRDSLPHLLTVDLLRLEPPLARTPEHDPFDQAGNNVRSHRSDLPTPNPVAG